MLPNDQERMKQEFLAVLLALSRLTPVDLQLFLKILNNNLHTGYQTNTNLTQLSKTALKQNLIQAMWTGDSSLSEKMNTRLIEALDSALLKLNKINQQRKQLLTSAHSVKLLESLTYGTVLPKAEGEQYNKSITIILGMVNQMNARHKKSVLFMEMKHGNHASGLNAEGLTEFYNSLLQSCHSYYENSHLLKHQLKGGPTPDEDNGPTHGNNGPRL